MPITKSAIKAMRVSARKNEKNRAIRSAMKTKVTKAESAVAAGKTEPAVEAVKGAASALDKAVIKGIIHPNNAARRKSRLAKKLNQAAEPKK